MPIQSFGSSLLANPPVNKAPETSVDEILARTPKAPGQQIDTYQPSQAGYQVSQSKAGNRLFNLAMYGIGAIGLFIAGRKGAFGKTIQTWFGGRLSKNNAHGEIVKQMEEYLSKFGDRYKSVKIDKSTKDPVIVAERNDGTLRLFSIEDTKSTIKLKDIELQKDVEEVFIFNRNDASPLSRVKLIKDKNGRTIEYISYKDSQMMNKNFDDKNGAYKRSIIEAHKKFGLFGPRREVRYTYTYNNPDSGEPVITKIKKYFSIFGKKVKQKFTTDNVKKVYKYNNIDKVSSVEVKQKAVNGQKAPKPVYIHYNYATTPEGEIVRTGQKVTSDKKGTKPILQK